MPFLTTTKKRRSGESDLLAGGDDVSTSNAVSSPVDFGAEASADSTAQDRRSATYSSRLTDLLRRRQQNRRSASRQPRPVASPSAVPNRATDEQLRTSFRSAKRSPRMGDRRQYPRRGSCGVVRVLPNRQEVPLTPNSDWAYRSSDVGGDLVDVSMNGAQFLSSVPLETNSSIQLQMTHVRRDFSAARSASVVRCEPDGEGRWRVTCRFDRTVEPG